MRLRLIAAFGPLALLAACGGNPQTASGPTVATPGTMPPVEAEEKAADLAAVPAAPVTEPARLKGLSQVQVKAVLGMPMFTRRDSPAEIWQYRSRACTLDIFLYDDQAGQTVAHYAVRSGTAIGEKECFDELMARMKAAPDS